MNIVEEGFKNPYLDKLDERQDALAIKFKLNSPTSPTSIGGKASMMKHTYK
jgi:hypothetical protein